jgi:hypothetical protein
MKALARFSASASGLEPVQYGLMVHPFASSRPGRKPFLFALLPLLALTVLGCKSDGSECDTCTTDADCKAGLVCSNFKNDDGSSAGQRCGSGTGATQCRVR